jgi:hypothetical protein
MKHVVSPLPQPAGHPNTNVANNLGHARGTSQAEYVANLARHDDARERVFRIIDALELVSIPEIETDIDIMQKLPLFQGWAAKSNWFTWLAPPDATTLSRYGYNQPPDHRETRFLVQEQIKGYVLPFIFGGRQVYPRNIRLGAREYHMIIAGDGSHRSWLGGQEHHDARPLPRPNLGDLPPAERTSHAAVIDALPDRIATGDDIVNSFQKGFHGDRAIEGTTATEEPDNVDREVTRLWVIGNALIKRADAFSLDIASHLPSDPADPAVKPDLERLPPPL